MNNKKSKWKNARKESGIRNVFYSNMLLPDTWLDFLEDATMDGVIVDDFCEKCDRLNSWHITFTTTSEISYIVGHHMSLSEHATCNYCHHRERHNFKFTASFIDEWMDDDYESPFGVTIYE